MILLICLLALVGTVPVHETIPVHGTIAVEKHDHPKLPLTDYPHSSESHLHLELLRQTAWDLAVLHSEVGKNLHELSNQLAESCQTLQQNVCDPAVLHLEVVKNLYELAGSCQMLQQNVLDLAVLQHAEEPMDLAVQHLGVIWQEPSALQPEQPLEVAWSI